MAFNGVFSKKTIRRLKRKGTKREPMPESLRAYAGRLDEEYERPPMPDEVSPDIAHECWSETISVGGGRKISNKPSLEKLDRRALTHPPSPKALGLC
jgi:hypothetical protein